MSGGLRSARRRAARATVGLTVDVPRHEDRGPLQFGHTPADFDALASACLSWADRDPGDAWAAFIATVRALPADVGDRLHGEAIRRTLTEPIADPFEPPEARARRQADDPNDDPGAPPF